MSRLCVEKGGSVICGGHACIVQKSGEQGEEEIYLPIYLYDLCYVKRFLFGLTIHYHQLLPSNPFLDFSQA